MITTLKRCLQLAMHEFLLHIPRAHIFNVQYVYSGARDESNAHFESDPAAAHLFVLPRPRHKNKEEEEPNRRASHHRLVASH